jgi:hypothetical protein
MIGIDYLTRLYQIISESSDSGWVDKKTSFDFLYEAAKDMAKETKCFTSTATLTTVATQSSYALPPGFLEILTDDGNDNKTVKYYDGSNYSWPTWMAYKDSLAENNTTAVSIPQNFSLCDASVGTRITGTATATGTATGGESTLTDTAAAFSATTCFAGDTIYNTTKGYVGFVISVTDATHLLTAMFDITSSGSPYAGWASSDAYFIQPAPRYNLVLSAPSLTAGHTITVSYFMKPAPVYSDYGSYPFAPGYEEAVLKYAVWLYKYRDSKPQFGNALYQAYDMQIRKANNVHQQATGARRLRVSFIKR